MSAGAPVRASASTAAPPFPFPTRELERIEAPDLALFRRRYLHRWRPVVLTGVTRDWLPPEQWTFERLTARYGDARVIAVGLAGGTLLEQEGHGVVFRHEPLGEVIRSLAAPGTGSHYVMAPTWNFPEAFQKEYRVPVYCAGAPHMRAKVWVGKEATVTPLHVDVPHNLHVHLSGRKRWLLVPASQARRLYLRGPFSGMPAFAQVDPEKPDYDRFPRFRGVKAYTATLGPGETLFIPQGWWHHTRSLDDAISMNFWWGGPVIHAAATASTLFKRALGIRSDEWG
jgi:lysine-specific demethylase 8